MRSPLVLLCLARLHTTHGINVTEYGIDVSKLPFRCASYDRDEMKCTNAHFSGTPCELHKGKCRLKGRVQTASTPPTPASTPLSPAAVAAAASAPAEVRTLFRPPAWLSPPLQDVFALEPNSILDGRLAARGVEGWGHDAPFGCLLWRLQKGERITVGALGSSISAGSTYRTLSEEHGKQLFHSKLVQSLNLLFPTAQPHVHHNGAVAAAGPNFFERCLNSQLPAQPSLVLVEFSQNILRDTASYERLLRGLLRLKPRPAILALSNHIWQMGDPNTSRLARGVCWNHPDVGISRLVNMASDPLQACGDPTPRACTPQPPPS